VGAARGRRRHRRSGAGDRRDGGIPRQAVHVRLRGRVLEISGRRVAPAGPTAPTTIAPRSTSASFRRSIELLGRRTRPASRPSSVTGCLEIRNPRRFRGSDQPAGRGERRSRGRSAGFVMAKRRPKPSKPKRVPRRVVEPGSSGLDDDRRRARHDPGRQRDGGFLESRSSRRRPSSGPRDIAVCRSGTPVLFPFAILPLNVGRKRTSSCSET